MNTTAQILNTVYVVHYIHNGNVKEEIYTDENASIDRFLSLWGRTDYKQLRIERRTRQE